METAAPTPSRHADALPPEPFAPGALIAVLLPLPLAGPYDYRVPPGLDLRPGDVVLVPLGRRQERGVVWGLGAGTLDAAKVRAVLARLPDAPSVPEASRRFVDWVAAYTLSAPGAVLRMVLSVPDALEATKPGVAFRATGVSPEAVGMRMTEARRRVLDACAGQPPLPAAELARVAATSAGVVKGLAEAGLLETVLIDPMDAESQADGDHPGPTLSADQAEAAGRLVAALDGGFSVTLLEGVTGSGKTEVYFEAVAAALRAGRQILVLVPEITLTAQWLDRFAVRFGAAPLVWHSEVSPARRRRTWRAVAQGKAAVVVGARSALFLPYHDLGLIIVDEEHEQAFKQEEGVVYHARDMAVVRGQVGSVPVVLASATPSLETAQNAQAGRYARVHLPSRHAGASLPDVRVIDMRRTPPDKVDWGRSWLAPALVQAITDTLAAGEQSLLFLNRRGYAPLTLCRACGHRMQCPNCTAWLVEHRAWSRLQCHHCGHSTPLPRECPACGAEDQLAACGPGVERLAEEIAKRFPEARSALVASDTLSGPGATAELVRKVTDKELDLLIGTQILAKGLHFPNLTLVGVIDADLGLSGGDLRAAERTFQLLSQVAGRAGRGERPGTVYLQTYQPEHPVLQAMASGDADLFLEAESEGRRLLGMPPFGRLAALIVSGPDEAAVESAARALGRTAPRHRGVEVLGPAPAPLAVLRGRHRWRLLLKAPRAARVQPMIRGWLNAVHWPASVRVQVDIDPYGFL